MNQICFILQPTKTTSKVKTGQNAERNSPSPILSEGITIQFYKRTHTMH